MFLQFLHICGVYATVWTDNLTLFFHRYTLFEIKNDATAATERKNSHSLSVFSVSICSMICLKTCNQCAKFTFYSIDLFAVVAKLQHLFTWKMDRLLSFPQQKYKYILLFVLAWICGFLLFYSCCLSSLRTKKIMLL